MTLAQSFGVGKRTIIEALKVAHSVSFETFYLVMFHGNQII
jgi:hypothetical protein